MSYSTLNISPLKRVLEKCDSTFVQFVDPACFGAEVADGEKSEFMIVFSLIHEF
jgi:hypothetical protein